MKLFIKQKVFSLNEKFTIKDDLGVDKYIVEGDFFTIIEKKLRLYNMQNQELALVKKRFFTFLPQFEIIIDEKVVAEIHKEFTFFTNKYTFKGLDWTVDGDFMGHDYQIYSGTNPIASVHKQWMSWGDCYELDIADGVNEIIALSAVLAIDSVLDTHRSSNF